VTYDSFGRRQAATTNHRFLVLSIITLCATFRHQARVHLGLPVGFQDDRALCQIPALLLDVSAPPPGRSYFILATKDKRCQFAGEKSRCRRFAGKPTQLVSWSLESVSIRSTHSYGAPDHICTQKCDWRSLWMQVSTQGVGGSESRSIIAIWKGDAKSWGVLIIPWTGLEGFLHPTPYGSLFSAKWWIALQRKASARRIPETAQRRTLWQLLAYTESCSIIIWEGDASL
jgi:hypothetical protein